MKALVKSEARPGIWMQDIEIPKVGPNDVLIRIGKTAICGTDMHIYNWDAWAQKTIPVPGASSTWVAKCVASPWAIACRARVT